jgi:hypothetical protein
MSLTRLQLRSTVRENLDQSQLSFYQDDEINDSLNDAYNEIVCKTRCVVQKVTLPWRGRVMYLNFLDDYNIADYLGVIGIFSNHNSLWLRDDVSIRDFNRIRRDWEVWIGAPQFWAPHSQKRIAIAPHFYTDTSDFDLWYYGTAPLFTDDYTPTIVANDMMRLYEYYSTADLLESAEEITKAGAEWEKFYKLLDQYKTRCHNLAESQLLLRI